MVILLFQGSYMTIHITPEPEFSYVSFESNIPEASYDEVIRRVLATFKPGKFVVTIFANKESVASEIPKELEQSDYLNFEGEWLRNDVQYCRFKNYDLTCAFYSKFPSWWFTDGPSINLERLNDRAITRPPLTHPNFPKKSVKVTEHHDNSKKFPKFNIASTNTHKLSIRGTNNNNANNNNNNKSRTLTKIEEYRSKRSASSPQLTTKPLNRSKVYRKTSLKTANVATEFPIDDPKVKWNTENVHITCNPLSNPYPYSTPCHSVKRENLSINEKPDDEPKCHSCASFLPILSLIPQTMVSFQYLSPKMKFSWWRNKISWRHA